MPLAPPKFDPRVLVLDYANGEECYWISAALAEHLCATEKPSDKPKALRRSRRCIQLTGWMEFHPCKTKTGRSYTYRQVLPPAVDLQKRGPQWESGTSSSSGHYAIAHKSIDSGDRGYFIQAVTDNIVFK